MHLDLEHLHVMFVGLLLLDVGTVSFSLMDLFLPDSELALAFI